MKALVGFCIVFQSACYSLQYELGQSYVYKLNSNTFLNDGSARLGQGTARDIGYGLEARAQLTTLWRDAQTPLNRIVEIDLAEAHLTVTPADKKKSEERKRHASNLDSASHHPMYVLYQDNEIVQVWVANDDDLTYLNVKKGVASLFQHQVTSETKQSQVDVSGKCKVVYHADGTHIKKSKEECIHPDREQYEHPSTVRSVKTKAVSQTNYYLLPDLSAVQNASSTEFIGMSVNAWPEASIKVTAYHNLELEGSSSSKAKVSPLKANDEEAAVKLLEAALKDRYKKDTIIARPHQLSHAENFKGTLADRISLFRDQLSTGKLATLKSSMAFVNLLESFRIASENDVFEALKNSKNSKIMPQLLDIAGASQTIAALKAALRVVKLESKDSTLSERFLMALSMASHPSPAFVAELQALASKKLSNEDVYATLIASLGSVLRHALGNDARMKEAHEARAWLEGQLGQCPGKDPEPCKLIFLRALKNAAHPLSIPALLKEVRIGSKKSGLGALKALKEIGSVFFTPEVFDTLEHVYFETKSRQESTARALAAEMIFASGDERRIERILAYIHNVGCPELQTFITNKFQELVGLGRSQAAKKAAANQTVSNYHSLAHGGTSATFTRFLARSRDLNTTYALNMELIPGGLLKQTTFDVNLQTSPTELMPLISVNIFAAGLAGIAGGDTTTNEVDTDGAEDEATAGIALSVLGVEMRPYVFFRGTGELMGHVWSGTASEYTPALQGNFLLMDHMQLQPLLSGLIVQLQLKGALSADLGGSVQISLWNRNSHSVVHSAGAGLIQGSARLLSDIASARVEVNVGFESYLDFITDFEFYEKPYKMCMVMTNPGLTMKHNVRKYETIEGKQHLVRTLRRRSARAEGKSFALTQKNSELCTELLGSKD